MSDLAGGGVGPLHEAIRDALHENATEQNVIAYDAATRAVLRVVGTQLHAEIEALPGYGRGDYGESLPDGHLLPRADVLVVVAALLEHPDA